MAAPTAGLHMDETLMVNPSGGGLVRLLCMGAGTFLPVRQSDINQHEIFRIILRFNGKSQPEEGRERNSLLLLWEQQFPVLNPVF